MHLTYAPDAIVLRVSDDGHGPIRISWWTRVRAYGLGEHARTGAGTSVAQSDHQRRRPGHVHHRFGADPLDVLFVRSPPVQGRHASASRA